MRPNLAPSHVGPKGGPAASRLGLHWGPLDALGKLGVARGLSFRGGARSGGWVESHGRRNCGGVWGSRPGCDAACFGFGAGWGISFFCTRPLASSTAGSSSYLPLLFPSLEAAASRGVEQPRGGGGGGSGLEGQEEEERLRRPQPQAGQDQAGGAAGSQGAWPEAPGKSQLPARGNCPPSPHIPRCSHPLPPTSFGGFLGQCHCCPVPPGMPLLPRLQVYPLPSSFNLPCPLPSHLCSGWHHG